MTSADRQVSGAQMGLKDTTAREDKLSDAYVQTVQSGPDSRTKSVRDLFFISQTQAIHSVDITTPYFVPGSNLTEALKASVARGVHVRLLVPHRSNHILVRLAIQSYFEELLEAGVQIYLYDKGVLHGKVMTVDGEVSVVGTANYDLRSFHLDYEVCEVIYSRDVARQLTVQFQQDLSNSTQLTLEKFRERPRLDRILEQVARLLAPLL